MTDTRWTVAVTDALTGRVWGVLPASSIRQAQALNLPGELTIGTPNRMDGDVTLREMAPWATLMFLLRDGVPIGPGQWLLRPVVNVADDTVEWSCLGFGSYWRRRALLADRRFDQVDQFDIVRNLISYAWSNGGGVRVDLGSQSSSMLRDRTYDGFQGSSIGELIENLAACQGGFNFRWQAAKVATWDGKIQFRNDLIFSEQFGRPTTFAFVAGGNCDVPSIDVDGSAMATHVTAVGAGELGEAPVVQVSQGATAWPRLDTVLNLNDIILPETLAEYAESAAALGARPIFRPTFSVHPDSDPAIGEYQVGDLCRIRGRFGLVDIDDDYVITETTLTVASGEEKVDITAVPAATLMEAA